MFIVIVAALCLSIPDLAHCTVDLAGNPDDMIVHKVIGNWEEAHLQCKSEDAVLASPINTALLNAMKSLIGVNNTPYFIGTRSKENSRSFISVEGVPLEKMNADVLAMIQQLDPEEGGCLSMDRHSIRVVPCWSRLPFICYKQQLQHSNITMDTPQKGVEHDGVCDGEGYKYENSTDSCYMLHKEEKDWHLASSTCASEGAHLVVIDDGVEAEVVRNMRKGTVSLTHIGLFYHEVEGKWMTTNGKLMEDVYHDWNYGHPVPSSSCYCVMILPTGKIDNYDCSVLSNFICEKAPHKK